MNYKLKNSILEIEINPLGAELWSIKKDNEEYLWQGCETSWKNRATNIFPYVGRLNKGVYSYRGKTYSLGNHGFARNSNFNLKEKTENSLTLNMSSNKETLNDYPFEFEFNIKYTISKNSIFISYEVENKNHTPMYFGVGGHPGFNLPLEPSLQFEDYYLEFCEECRPINYLTNENGLIADKTSYKLLEDKYLKLNHSLFDNDALIFENMAKSVTLKSNKSTKKIKLTYENMNFLGIWHTPKRDVNFICIEPWSSLPSRSSEIEDLENQKNLVRLEKGTYSNTWYVEIW